MDTPPLAFSKGRRHQTHPTLRTQHQQISPIRNGNTLSEFQNVPVAPETAFTLRPKAMAQLKLSTVLSLAASCFMLSYYLLGGHFLPLSFLLPIAGQVLARGLVAANEFLTDGLGHLALRRPIPLDFITSSMIEVDTRTGKKFNLPYLLVGGLVTLIFVNTPEVLLGTLATGRTDIRETGSESGIVELASFGGGFNKSVYYLSGLLLLSSPDPDTAYGEIGYLAGTPNDRYYVIPRKPTAFYAQFAEKGYRQNDREKRIQVARNEVAVLREVPKPNVDRTCRSFHLSDFGYSISMYTCDQGEFGFVTNGPDLPRDEGFFKLSGGSTSVRYSSVNGNRVINGSDVLDDRAVTFPRAEQLWHDMAGGFLNAISFNRVKGSLRVSAKLALSSLVRIGGFEHPSGFSDPAKETEAVIRTVQSSNLSKWVILTVLLSVAMLMLNACYYSFNEKLLSHELGQWIQIGHKLTLEGLLSSWARDSTLRRTTSRNVIVALKKVAHDNEELVLEPVRVDVKVDGSLHEYTREGRASSDGESCTASDLDPHCDGS